MRLARCLAAAAACACAKVEGPPGGPPDAAPPAIVQVQPESGAVVPDLRGDAIIRFDEVIDEQGGAARGGAASGLARLVLLSPVAGDVKVSWHRTAIHVTPREGWQTGRVYRLELLPGIVDLRRNRLERGRTLLFSTGPPIPNAVLRGTVVNWTAQRVLPRALIAAARLPDTVPYLALADSSGRFTLAGVPAGEYMVFALDDQNGNRRGDRREAYDSALVRVDTSARVDLWTFVHDSTGPRPRMAERIDSVTVRLTFTQALDPTAPLDTLVRLFALPDTTPVPIVAVLTPAAYDSLVARERAAADSARAAHDTTAADSAGAARDTSGRAAPPPRPARPSRPANGPPSRFPGTERPGGRDSGDERATGAAPARADSALRALLATRPVPSDRLMVRSAVAFRPGARYLVRVTAATNLNGATADGQQLLVIPDRAPADTSRT